MAEKYALLIGINSYTLYDPTGATNLSGCLNDVEDYRRLCLASGYRPANIHVLKDHEAKQDTILAEAEWLASKLNEETCNEGMFSYSGHGSLYKGRPMLCAADLRWENGLTFAKMGEKLKIREGVGLSSFLDCCHSGSKFRNNRNMIENLDDTTPASRFLPPPDDSHIGQELSVGGRDMIAPMLDSHRSITLSPDFNLIFTGCKLEQTSADAYIGGAYHGAFTYYLMQILRGVSTGSDGDDSYYRISYAALLEKLQMLLKRNGYDQVPQYTGPDAWKDLDVFRLPKCVVPAAVPAEAAPAAPSAPGSFNAPSGPLSRI